MEKEVDLKFIVAPLLEWYDQNKRDLPWRHNSTPYRVWISEIMLQQTRVDPVIPYYLRFMETFPSVESLADASEDFLMKMWEGLGYYSRARNLHKAAKMIAAAGEFPVDFSGWRALPGIGEYTAGAICSIALGLPTPAVDGNVLRVLSRVLGSYEDILSAAVKKNFSSSLKLVYPEGKTSEFTQGLMELGATVCLPNGAPLCDTCPWKSFCVAFKQGLIDEIPVKSEKKPRKKEKKTILILRSGNKVAIEQRPSDGLLANLWQFPNFDGHLTGKELSERYETDRIKVLNPSVHIFSHIEWEMIGYEILVDNEASGYLWLSVDEILSDKAIPTAFRCYTDHLSDIRFEEI